MTRRADLFATILAHPDDDTARLVYADVLEQESELARAMLIRHQCEMARLSRWDRRRVALGWEVERLLASHAVAWREELPTIAGIAWGTFARGFVTSVHVSDLGALYANHAAIAAATPVERVDLEKPIEVEPFPEGGIPWLRVLGIDAGDDEVQLHPASSILDAAPELVLGTGGYENAAMPWLAKRRAAVPLRRLATVGEHTVGLPFAEMIAAAPWLADLEVLDLGTTFVDRDTGYFQDPTFRAAGARLLRDAKLARVTTFGACNQRLGSDGTAAVVATMPRLVELDVQRCEITDLDSLATAGPADVPYRFVDLSDNAIGDAGLARLARAPRFAALEALHLDTCEIGATGIAALVASPCWHALRELVLSRNALGIDGCLALVDAPAPSRLHALTLENCDLSTDAGEILARVPWLATLQSIGVGANPLGGSPALFAALARGGVRALRAAATGLVDPTPLAPLWAHGTVLGLSANPIAEVGLAVLVDGGESSLQELDLTDCKLTGAAIEILARARMPNLRVLKLSHNPLGMDAIARLFHAPFVGALAELHITTCGADDRLADAIAKAPVFRSLELLKVRGSYLKPKTLMAIAELDLGSLRRVHVNGAVWDLPEAARARLLARFGRQWWYDAELEAEN